ncbi:MAG: gamma-glutamylcyclotransferase [Gammaproteobacteria bacterium]|nr:gamma-glutamylcyclotransferase [Gammaproteobacteria bacterium]NNJ92157.1 gamma-glutamylcyclotransferase [Gammaproteobacteria bacterium]
MNIFTYGTLMFSPVWDTVVKANYRAASATLRGYSRRKINTAIYPVAFQASPQDFINGIVYYDIEVADINRLDEFEGVYYRRTAISAELKDQPPVEADVYIIKSRYQHLISSEEWNPHDFQQRCLSEFMSAYEGFIDR